MPFASRRALAAGALVLLLAGGCRAAETAAVTSTEAPEEGSCRVLTAADLRRVSNGSPTVPCAESHTAQTYAVGLLPERLEEATYEAEEVATFTFRTCARRFAKFAGADESLVLRTVLAWVSFRPDEQAWDEGARWFRCDVVGAPDGDGFEPLPETAEGVLQGRPDDEWIACVDGDSVSTGVRVPCDEPHAWRAVTVIKVGEDDDPYPGDAQVEQRSHDFCSDSVAAWLDYPITYDFGFTWFGEREWAAGNRLSVCWARTAR